MKNKIAVVSICIFPFLSLVAFGQEPVLSAVPLKPNFEENLKSFYVILGVILALLVTINILTSVRLKKCYLIGVFDIKSYSWFLWKKTICN